MAKTIEQLKAQSAEVKNASVIGENTATRVGSLFNDIVEHVEAYEAGQAQKDTEQSTSINAETARATAAETTLSERINQEVTDRQAMDETIGVQLSNEIERAKGMELGISTKLNDEIERAQEAENDLQEKITSEAEARDLAVNNEAQARTQNDQLLSQAIAAEQERAEAAEQANATAINTQDQKLSELKVNIFGRIFGTLELKEKEAFVPIADYGLSIGDKVTVSYIDSSDSLYTRLGFARASGSSPHDVNYRFNNEGSKEVVLEIEVLDNYIYLSSNAIPNATLKFYITGIKSQIDSNTNKIATLEDKSVIDENKITALDLQINGKSGTAIIENVNEKHSLPISLIAGTTYHLSCEAHRIDTGGGTYKSLFALVNGTENILFRFVQGKSEHDITIEEGTTDVYFKNLEQFGISIDYELSLGDVAVMTRLENLETLPNQIKENSESIGRIASSLDGIKSSVVLKTNENAVINIDLTTGLKYHIHAEAKRFEQAGNANIRLIAKVNDVNKLYQNYNTLDIDYVVDEGTTELYFNNNEPSYYVELTYKVVSDPSIAKKIDTINLELKDVNGRIDNIRSRDNSDLELKVNKLVEFDIANMAQGTYYPSGIDCNNIGMTYIFEVSNLAVSQGLRIVKEDKSGNKSIVIALLNGRTYELTITQDYKNILYQHGENATLNPHVKLSVITYDPKPNDIRMVVPKNLYVATGTELTLFNEMVVTNCEQAMIKGVTGDTQLIRHDRYISYAPSDNSTNILNSPITVYTNIPGKESVKKYVNIYPIKSTSGSGKTLNVMAIGASTTDMGYYLELLHEMFNSDAMNVNFIGTRQSLGSLLPDGTMREKVMEEGRSGWRAKSYFCQDGTLDGKTSYPNPFYDTTKTAFALDAFNFSKYMQEQGFSSCDAVLFAFGGNDNVTTEQGKIDCKTYYDAIIASMKAYNPNIKIGIFMYQGGYIRYKDRAQINQTQALHKCIIDWYEGRENENLYIIPVGLNFDPIYDFSCQIKEVKCQYFDKNNKKATEYVIGHEVLVEDAIHPPVETGCRKMAVVCYSWLKYIGSLP